MKKLFQSILPAIILTIAVTAVTFAQKAEYVKQVIISNGGVFESTPPYTDYVTVQSYNPDTKVSTVFNTIYTQSTQDVVIQGNVAYVAAQDSIVMYNLDTYARIDAIADSGISRLGFCNGNLVVTKQFPIKRFFVEILNGASLALLARVENISGECGGVAVAGDSLYVAVNYGYAGTTGNLAVINPQNWKLVHEFPLGSDAKGLNDLYSSGNYIWGVARTPFGAGPQGGIVKFNYNTGVFSTTVIPYLISNGFGINGDLLYLVMNYAVGTFNLLTLTIENPTLLPDPGSLAHIYYISEAIDYVNGLIYTNIGNYSSIGAGFISTLAGDSVSAYQTGLNAQGMAIDFRTPTGIQDDQKQDFSFSVYPNPFESTLRISFSPNSTVNSLKVSDLTGREMKSAKIKEGTLSSTLDLGSLSAGVYLLTVTSDNGVQTRKIIKK